VSKDISSGLVRCRRHDLQERRAGFHDPEDVGFIVIHPAFLVWAKGVGRNKVDHPPVHTMNRRDSLDEGQPLVWYVAATKAPDDSSDPFLVSRRANDRLLLKGGNEIALANLLSCGGIA